MNNPEYMERLRKGLEMLQELEKVDDEETECLRLIGEVYLFRKRFDESEHYLRRAYALNPNDDRIQSQMSALLFFLGQQEEAEEFARQAIRSNPYHPSFYQFNLGRILMLQGKYDEAITALRAATPTQTRYKCYLAACYAAASRDEEARTVRDEIYVDEPSFSLEHFAVTFLFRDPALSEQLREMMVRAGLS